MNTPELIETHCHLNYAEQEQLPTLFANARKCGVNRMICIGASDGLKSIGEAIALAETYDFVWASAGLHPHDAGSFTSADEIEEIARHPRVVAVGETGLDFFRDWSPFDAQELLFKSQIELAKRVGKPLIIHCRDAMKQTVALLQEGGADTVGGVFHCFAGTARDAAVLREMNFLVSFTGNLTFKKAVELREAAKEIPLDQIMVETDMPYMAPEPFRGKPSEPMHVYQVALKLAEIKHVTFEEVAARTTANAERLFKLPAIKA
ncbi:MAG: TatD family hydrolase [Bdellovibrionales bacterium]|nr:TatD family hydrolase [Bdellovibrionales bacterium]